MQPSMGAAQTTEKQAFILELSAFEFEKLRDALKAAIASIDPEAESLKLRAERKALEEIWDDLLVQAPAELR
jgi:hypothetical protein